MPATLPCGPLTDRIDLLGNRFFNIYLVRGTEHSALVEVGVSATADALVRQLRARGCRPSYLVVTHAHSDHLTGLGALREAFPDATPLAGQGAAAFASHPQAAAALLHEDRRMSAALAERGCPPGRPPVPAAPDLGAARVLEDGAELDLGGCTLRFLSVPGHAPGGLAVQVPEEDTLLASDSLGFRYGSGGFAPLFFTGFADYLTSLERLAGLRPRVLGLAHQGALVGDAVAEAFAGAAASAEQLRARVRARPDDPGLAEELFREIYREEMALYSEENIRTCAQLLVRRAAAAGPPEGDSG